MEIPFWTSRAESAVPPPPAPIRISLEDTAIIRSVFEAIPEEKSDLRDQLAVIFRGLETSFQPGASQPSNYAIAINKRDIRRILSAAGATDAETIIDQVISIYRRLVLGRLVLPPQEDLDKITKIRNDIAIKHVARATKDRHVDEEIERKKIAKNRGEIFNPEDNPPPNIRDEFDGEIENLIRLFQPGDMSSNAIGDNLKAPLGRIETLLRDARYFDDWRKALKDGALKEGILVDEDIAVKQTLTDIFSRLTARPPVERATSVKKR